MTPEAIALLKSCREGAELIAAQSPVHRELAWRIAEGLSSLLRAAEGEDPARCQECSAPSNNAEGFASGKCPACS